MTEAPRLVVLRPLGLGDFLTGIPAYRALARAFPRHTRILAAPRALHGLAMRCGAFAECVDTHPLEPLQARLDGSDIAVDLHGRGPESQRILLAAKPNRLISFACHGVPETYGHAEWRPVEHEVTRWCRMLEYAGIRCDSSDLLLDHRAFATGVRGVTVVHPGADSRSRRWPPERFAAIVRDERARGRAVLVTGSPDERPLALEVAKLGGIEASCAVAGRTSLEQLASLVASAGRVLCGDTGISHLATAFGTPSVTLFGPTSPETWGPPLDPRHRVLWHGVTGDPHGGSIDPGLLSIEVDEVRTELLALDAERPSGQRGGSFAASWNHPMPALRSRG